MTYPKEVRAEARKLREEGYIFAEIAHELKIGERTVRRWAKDWQTPKGPQLSPGESDYEWPDITAGDLEQAGINPELTIYVMGLLGIARQHRNTRLPCYLYELVATRKNWPKMPAVWAALIAGFPIVAQDIGVPAFSELAMLVREIQPHLGSVTRREYHRRARPIMESILAQTRELFLGAITVKDFERQVISEMEQRPGFEPLAPIFGRFDPVMVTESTMEVLVKKKWVEWLVLLLRLLPDPDRHPMSQIGQILPPLMLVWCSTRLEDFRPPLPRLIG